MGIEKKGKNRKIEFLHLHTQVVAPKKAKLLEAETTLSATMELLNAKRAELAEIEDKVQTLKNQFQEMTDKKAQLEFQVCFIHNGFSKIVLTVRSLYTFTFYPRL